MAENAQTLEIDLNAAVKELRISIEENRKIDPVQVVREYARIAPHHNLTPVSYTHLPSPRDYAASRMPSSA